MSNDYPPDWDRRRKLVYRRDGYRCQKCGAAGGAKGNAELHAHHIRPKSDGGSHHPSNLKTLCQTCHSRVHGHPVGGASRKRSSRTRSTNQRSSQTSTSKPTDNRSTGKQSSTSNKQEWGPGSKSFALGLLTYIIGGGIFSAPFGMTDTVMYLWLAIGGVVWFTLWGLWQPKVTRPLAWAGYTIIVFAVTAWWIPDYFGAIWSLPLVGVVIIVSVAVIEFTVRFGLLSEYYAKLFFGQIYQEGDWS